MTSTNKSTSTQKQFSCDVCKISISTEAEYALHEFSKKHCDNLVRIAKNKPIISKQKGIKTESASVNKEVNKTSVVTTHGNFAKYGYFVQGEVYDTRIETKEFNMEYDPYVQKFAENPLKEIFKSTPATPVEMPSVQMTNITSFKRKKKKKIRACQICNISLSTVPEYEAHMRSPQHSWKLKLCGMGVSAHFVKASSDLHTIEMNEDSTSSEKSEPLDSKLVSNSEGSTSSVQFAVFPTLYCDICQLLLNSEQQYNAHVNGKSHNENVQKKAESKAKKQRLESPNPNQLYCYSCKVALNNLYQYNEHKFGKKHKMRCRRLMREGITIPPEERIPSLGVSKPDPNKRVIYPEMYEKCVLEIQKKDSMAGDGMLEADAECQISYCESCAISFNSVSELESHAKSEEHVRRTAEVNIERRESQNSVNERGQIFQNDKTVQIEEAKEKMTGNISSTAIESENTCETTERVPEVKIIKPQDVIKCNVCSDCFTEQSQFEFHLKMEDHAKKVLDLKNYGTGDDEILQLLLRDRAVVKPDQQGTYFCGVCSVTTRSVTEFEQHISSLVHRQSDEDYQSKRKIEVRFAVNPDENGSYMCKACRECFATMVEYNSHLHTSKHREIEKAGRTKAKKEAVLLQRRRVKHKYMISGLKRKDFACWRKKCEKNPGVRTKITGMAMDLHTGMKAKIPNLEPLESKIDSVKNVFIGATAPEEPKPESSKRPRRNKRKNGGKRRGVKETHGIKSLMALPISCPFPLRPQPPPDFAHPINWGPYPPSYQYRPNAYVCPSRPHYSPMSYYRYHSPWSKYPPSYR